METISTTTQNITKEDLEDLKIDKSKPIKIIKEESLETRVKEWTQTYADTITENYRNYHQESGYRDRENLQYYKVKTGKKYYKIVSMEFDDMGQYATKQYKERSVHAFVDRKTGQVYKPSSWNAPAKHVRFDMRIITEREFLHNAKNLGISGWAGGYLYIR